MPFDYNGNRGKIKEGSERGKRVSVRTSLDARMFASKLQQKQRKGTGGQRKEQGVNMRTSLDYYCQDASRETMTETKEGDKRAVKKAGG